MIIDLIFIFLFFLVGCYDSAEKKSFQKYVDYSGMKMVDLKTVFIPDSQVVLDLGAICIDSYTQMRYNRQGEVDTRKHPCFRIDNIRNYFESVPEQLKKAHIDSLLLNANNIQTIPEWLLKKELKHLDLASNKIQNISIPKECGVESIDLRGNLLTKLPEGTFQCEKLKILYLDKSLKKHSVVSDTIIVHSKKMIFGKGYGEIDFLEKLKAKQNNQYPKAVYIDKW